MAAHDTPSRWTWSLIWTLPRDSLIRGFRDAAYYTAYGPCKRTTLELTGDGLTLDDADASCTDRSSDCLYRLRHGGACSAARRCLEKLLAEMLYGVNTGFGKLANRRIEPHAKFGAFNPPSQPRRRYGAALERWHNKQYDGYGTTTPPWASARSLQPASSWTGLDHS